MQLGSVFDIITPFQITKYNLKTVPNKLSKPWKQNILIYCDIFQSVSNLKPFSSVYFEFKICNAEIYNMVAVNFLILKTYILAIY